MSNIVKALCWAAAILLVALGNASGLIADSSANTMFAILPALAVISLSGPRACRPTRRGTGA